MLLSAGGFAYYRAETHVFSVLVPRFGNLSSVAAKEKLMKKWLGSVFFRRSGLDAEEIKAKVLAECRNGGDFLRIVMGSIARRQRVSRWADCTPAHVLHMAQIKKAIPEAIFVHIIRDGRDVALSLERAGWVSPFPWDKKRARLVAGLRWEWIVDKGRKEGRALGADYMEVRFESLVTNPHETLCEIGSFIDHNLDYDHIQRVGVGSVKKPNTSFKSELQEGTFNPIGRWKEEYSRDELRTFEEMIGEFLRELGYELATAVRDIRGGLRLKLMRSGYRSYCSAKQWAKVKTALSRYMTDIELLSE
jgi:hypothetical protein